MLHPILGELVIVFLTVIVVMLLLQRLRQSAIVGYLLTGIIVGPHGFGWVSDREAVDLLAEVGVALLLFTLGIEFSLKKLEQMRQIVLRAGSLQVSLAAGSTLVVLLLLGQSPRTGLFWGLLVALSSTAIVTKILIERGELTTAHGKISLALLIFQDICVVPMLMLLPSLVPGETWSLVSLLLLLVKSAVTMIGLFVGARYIFPFMLERIVRLQHREMFIIGVIAVALATAWLAQSFGLSLAFGAFLAGLLLSESEYRHQVLTEVTPFRDIFSSLFFISVGMLIDIGTIGTQAPMVLGLGLAIVLGKALTAVIAVLAVRFPLRIAVLVGLGVAQVGEFSFILLRQGRALDLITENQYQIFLGATGLSILLVPLLIHFAPHVAFHASLPARLDRLFGPHIDSLEEEETTLKNHVIVCGYGLNGRLLAKVLFGKHIPYLVLEVNGELVQKGRQEGEKIYYGDCTRKEILMHAGIQDARAIVFAITNPSLVGRAVRMARSLSESIAIIVRTRQLKALKELYESGATTAVSEELGAVFEIQAHVLHLYGTLPEDLGRRVEALQSAGYPDDHDRQAEEPSFPSLGRGLQSATLALDRFTLSIGTRLDQLAIPESTGVLLVAVVRHGNVMTNPRPNLQLQPHDCLLVQGTHEQIASAEKVLREGPPGTLAN